MKKMILILVAGRTDIQIFVKNKSEETFLTEIDKYSVRNFHEALISENENLRLPYTFGKTTGAIKKQDSIKWVNGKFEFDGSKDYEVCKEKEQVLLALPKLTRVVELAQEQKYEIKASIIINTNRNSKNKYSDVEPIACGKILSKWLASNCNLQFSSKQEPGEGIATWIDIVDGHMSVFEPNRNDRPNRKAIQRIDDKLKDFCEKNHDWFVGVSLGGGISVFKDPIKACAEYHFGKENVIQLQEPEEKSNTPVSAKFRISTTESFRLRSYVTNLIHKGNFTGAYAAARYVEDDEQEKKWIQYVKETYLYFTGRLAESQCSDFKSLQTLLLRSECRCLIAAMRVESALKSREIHNAINWTCTFLEAALLDFIEKDYGKIHFYEREIHLYESVNANELQPLLTSNQQNKNCLEQYQDRIYKYYMTNYCRKKWCQFLKEKNVENFRQKLHKGRISAYNYRNLNIHGKINQEDMKSAEKHFKDTAIWKKEKSSLSFLCVDEVVSILAALGIKSENLYSKLVQELSHILSKHKIL